MVTMRTVLTIYSTAKKTATAGFLSQSDAISVATESVTTTDYSPVFRHILSIFPFTYPLNEI